MAREPFISRVRIRNYKSIAVCDVHLGRLSVLVGRNGSGKSNFLDALRFIADGLQTSLDHAIKSRGGIDDVRRRSTGHPNNFSIEVNCHLTDDETAAYAIEIAAAEKGGFVVKRERLIVRSAAGRVVGFDVVGDKLRTTFGRNGTSAPGELQPTLWLDEQAVMPPPSADRLYLVTASGRSEFRGAYDALRAMGFYNLNPDEMKEIQSADSGELLKRDGSNIASVVANLAEDRGPLKQRIREYLQQIVPDIVDFQRKQLAHRETLVFLQEVKGSKRPWQFLAGSMSDGTLRALGILVAVMQLADRKAPIRLVGIEEPETALHPEASGALMDALREAAEHTQVVITTHSPDLLDELRFGDDCLLVVAAKHGTTQIAPTDRASIQAIQEHLYSAGDLLRMDQLQPDVDHVQKQLSLPFDMAEDT